MEYALLYTESQCSFQSTLESSVTPRYLAEFWVCKLVPWILYVKSVGFCLAKILRPGTYRGEIPFYSEIPSFTWY